MVSICRTTRCIRQSIRSFSTLRRHLSPPKANTNTITSSLQIPNIPRFSIPTSQSLFNPPTFSYRYLSSSPPPTDSKEPKSEKAVDDDDAKTPEGGEKSKEGSANQSGAEEGKAVRGSPVSWMSFLLLCLTGVGLIFYFDKRKKEYIEAMNKNANKETTAKEEPSVGKAAIGGPFSLVNHEGKAVTEKDFKGMWTLVYFGFTHCPDICPDELQKLAAAIDKIKEKGIEVLPLFISVDPERDTVKQIHDYVKEFHPDLVGLTGSPEAIKNVARAYRVYYMKTEDDDSDYLVDHSIVMYLMDPDMEFVKFFGKNENVDTLSEGIVNEITQYKK